jgi:Protein of unknown function (DUF2695)
MALEILTPASPRWSLFVRLLGDTITDGLPKGTWRCGNDGSGSKHRYAEAVLTELGGIDIDGTLALFRRHGGYCDCEILFNVDRPDKDNPPRSTGITPAAA